MNYYFLEKKKNMFVCKLKFGLIQYRVRSKPKSINKSSDKRGLDLFEQGHRKSLGVFLKFLKFWKLNEALSEVRERWDSYLQTWNFLKKQDFLIEKLMKFLRNKLL